MNDDTNSTIADVDNETLLTTLDNPFNPFTDFANWYQCDVTLGYNTCSLIARLLPPIDGLPPKLEHLLYLSTVRTIIDIDVTNQYVLVTADTFKPIVLDSAEV